MEMVVSCNTCIVLTFKSFICTFRIQVVQFCISNVLYFCCATVYDCIHMFIFFFFFLGALTFGNRFVVKKATSCSMPCLTIFTFLSVHYDIKCCLQCQRLGFSSGCIGCQIFYRQCSPGDPVFMELALLHFSLKLDGLLFPLEFCCSALSLSVNLMPLTTFYL